MRNHTCGFGNFDYVNCEACCEIAEDEKDRFEWPLAAGMISGSVRKVNWLVRERATLIGTAERLAQDAPEAEDIVGFARLFKEIAAMEDAPSAEMPAKRLAAKIDEWVSGRWLRPKLRMAFRAALAATAAAEASSSHYGSRTAAHVVQVLLNLSEP